MKYEKKVVLKDGRDCVIRSCSGADAREVLDCLIKTRGETDYLLGYPDETDFTEEKEREFLTDKENNEKEVHLCAVVDGRIVGTAGIDSVGSKYKVAHRAEYGISIEKDNWGSGIGRALTEGCIECAKTAGFSRVELTVVAGNNRAIELYKSLGFTEYGRDKTCFFSRYSGWQEAILMKLEFENKPE